MGFTRLRLAASVGGIVIACLIQLTGCGTGSDETRSSGRALQLTPPEWLTIRNSPVMAISPDGTSVVSASGSSGVLYRRPVEGGDTAALEGTQGASAPFFSPDGRWVAFFSGDRLQKIPAVGGAVETVCQPCPGASGTWTSDGLIIFEQDALWKVPASGGTPELVTRLIPGENSHSFPDMLPGGKAVIFTNTTTQGWNDGQIVAQVLETGERRTLVEKATHARYVPTGHLSYVQGGVLMAVPFDSGALQVAGPAVPLLEDVLESSSGAAHYSFSATGTLAYVSGGIVGGDRTLVMVDRQGTEERVQAAEHRYGYFRLSPDGQTLAIQIDWPTVDIWLYDMTTHSMRQMTTGGAEFPWWTPDGSRVTFYSGRAGVPNIFWQSADGSQPAEQLTFSKHPVDHSFSWSPDGQILAHTVTHPNTGMDIWMQPRDNPGAARPYLQTRNRECCPVFSPDGRRVAFLSNQSGRAEVYISRFPGPPRPQQISTNGGVEPLWSRDGKELFFWSLDRQLMAAEVPADVNTPPGAPSALFGGTFLSAAASWRTRVDVTPDGSRFILIRRGPDEDETKEIQIISNWFARLIEPIAEMPGAAMQVVKD